jgi:hypothetical protein
LQEGWVYVGLPTLAVSVAVAVPLGGEIVVGLGARSLGRWLVGRLGSLSKV